MSHDDPTRFTPPAQRRGDDYDFIWKVVLCGDTGVGKTNVLLRYTQNRFLKDSKTTIGVEIGTKDVEVDGTRARLQIWDTAGQEKFKAMAHVYYRRAAGAVLVYDMTKHGTFRGVQAWLKELRENADDDAVVILVANKRDLRHLRAVTQTEAETYAEKEGILFIEASAQDSTNVDTLFDLLCTEILRRMKEKQAARERELAQHNDDGGGKVDIAEPEPSRRKISLARCCKT